MRHPSTRTTTDEIIELTTTYITNNKYNTISTNINNNNKYS